MKKLVRNIKRVWTDWKTDEIICIKCWEDITKLPKVYTTWGVFCFDCRFQIGKLHKKIRQCAICKKVLDETKCWSGAHWDYLCVPCAMKTDRERSNENEKVLSHT